MLLGLAWLVCGIWLWLLVGHGRFWISGPTLADQPAGCKHLAVTVVIPARNEAEHIVATLQSLLEQHFEGSLRIILVDDSSTDGTGELARKVMEQDQRLRVLSGAILEAGWTGKMWAVSQGLKEPEALRADYVLLTDADIVHASDHIALLTTKAEREQLNLVSEMVRLRCTSFAERATIPAFVFFFQLLYPFRWVNDPRRSIAAAAGGTMLLARRALDRIGGVASIRGALIDDVALAREVKRGGHALWLGHANDTVSERRYPALRDVWKMIARTAYVQLNYSPVLLLGTCLGLLLVYGGPVLGLVFGTGVVKGLGATCWAMMAIAFQPTLRRYRCNPLWALALPAIALFYFAATCGSAAEFYRGNGGQWKDRTYPNQSY